jgi:hypothetical protein
MQYVYVFVPFCFNDDIVGALIAACVYIVDEIALVKRIADRENIKMCLFVDGWLTSASHQTRYN